MYSINYNKLKKNKKYEFYLLLNFNSIYQGIPSVFWGEKNSTHMGLKIKLTHMGQIFLIGKSPKNRRDMFLIE